MVRTLYSDRQPIEVSQSSSKMRGCFRVLNASNSITVAFVFAILINEFHFVCVANEVEECTGSRQRNASQMLNSIDELMVDRVLGKELNARYHEMGKLSDSDEHLSRTFLSDAWFKSASLLKSWMEDAGLVVWTDAIGNVRGRTPPEISDDKPALFMGSHFDTVHDGGKYDGMLGILNPISAVKALLLDLSRLNSFDVSDSKKKTKLERPVEVIAFGDEEGVRFFSKFISSRALSGDLTATDDLNTYTDAANKTLAQALNENGLDGSVEAISKDILDPLNVYAFVESHIEQGPVLEQMNLPLASVEAIIGSSSLMFALHGTQGHAGTVRMSMRRDAVAALAEIIVEVEKLCVEHDRVKEDMLVCTIARVHVKPNIVNVISGDVTFTTDLRALSDDLLDEIVLAVREIVARVAKDRGLESEIIKERVKMFSMRMDESISRKLVAAGEEAYLSSEKIWGANMYIDNVESQSHAGIESGRVPVLPSGAGHDTEEMAKLTSRVSMLWVRCRDGISHSPLEFVTERDVSEAGMALFHFLRNELYPHRSQDNTFGFFNSNITLSS